VALEFDRGELGTVYVDGRAIYRVILNLLMNAVEACEAREEGPRSVTLTTRAESQGSIIEVRDTGVGIPPEIRDKLSQAFVSTKGSRGTGLGLACSYKIVREHGGSIEVDSEVGQGTTFTVFLPNQTLLKNAAILKT